MECAERATGDGLDRGHFYAPTVVTGVTEEIDEYLETKPAGIAL